MFTHADKAEGSQRRSVPNGASLEQSGGESTSELVDNRPEAIAQRRLQDMTDDSPRVLRLKAFQEMADRSPKVDQISQMQAMADHRAVRRQQPIQSKGNNEGRTIQRTKWVYLSEEEGLVDTADPARNYDGATKPPPLEIGHTWDDVNDTITRGADRMAAICRRNHQLRSDACGTKARQGKGTLLYLDQRTPSGGLGGRSAKGEPPSP